MKSIAEIIDEYERNLTLLRERRDELAADRAAEPSFERRRKLTMRILELDHCIGQSASALWQMRRYSHG